MKDFYVFLTSAEGNASKGHLQATFPQPVQLNNCQLALASLYLPAKPINVPVSRVTFRSSEHPEKQDIIIDKGHYESIVDLLQDIDRRIKSKDIKLSYDKHTLKTYISLTERASIQFSDSIAAILGLPRDTIRNSAVSLNTGLVVANFSKNIVVQCNCAKPQLLNAKYVPVLKLFGMPFGNNMDFTGGTYVDACDGIVNTVTIDIIDCRNGELVDFLHDSVLATVHIREKT